MMIEGCQFSVTNGGILSKIFGGGGEGVMVFSATFNNISALI